MSDHPIGQWLYRVNDAGELERRRIGYQPVWEKCVPEQEGRQTLIPRRGPGDGRRSGAVWVGAAASAQLCAASGE